MSTPRPDLAGSGTVLAVCSCSVLPMFARHGIGHGENEAVALDCRGKRKPNAGIPARGFDDRHARALSAAPFRVINQRDT